MNILKELIFKVLFPTEYRVYSQHEEIQRNRYCDNIKQLYEKDLLIRSLEKENAHLLRYFKTMCDANRNSRQMISFEKNKNDEYVIVTKWITDTYLWIVLDSPKYSCVNPRIMATIVKRPALNLNYINIEDIQMEDDNIGNGSIAMRHFLQVAEELRVDEITGWLSDRDKDHWDRSVHFYRKFGFEVVFNEKRTSGSIKFKFNRP